MSSSLEDLVLRECYEEDIPAITAIYGHAVRHGFGSFELEPPGEAEMKIRRRLLLAARYPYVVAEDAGKVVGYAYAGAYHSRPGYVKTVENSVYVRDGFHGRGIGGKLLAELIEQATALGFRQMVAVIGDSGNKSSIRLHEKLGFSLVGTLRSVGWKQEHWLDTVLMQRTLGEGDATPV